MDGCAVSCLYNVLSTFHLLRLCCARPHTHTHTSAPPNHHQGPLGPKFYTPSAIAPKSVPLVLLPSSPPSSQCFPPLHSFLCLLSFLLCYAISLTIFSPSCGGSLGFSVKQTKIVNFFGIQKVEQDAQDTKCRLSKGNSFLPPACTIALHNCETIFSHWLCWMIHEPAASLLLNSFCS